MKLGRKLHFSSVSARNLIPQFFNPQLFPSWYVRFILGTINPQAIDIALKISGVIYYVGNLEKMNMTNIKVVLYNSNLVMKNSQLFIYHPWKWDFDDLVLF